MMQSVAATRGDGALLRLVHQPSEDHVWLSLGLLAALLLHAAAVFGIRGFLRPPALADSFAPTTELTEVDLPNAPPSAVEQPPKPEAPSPKPPATPAKTEAAPAAARAAAVLTRDPDPNEPVDLTEGFVSGSAATYVGGQTSAAGKSTSAVHSPPATTGVVGGTGKPDAPVARSGPDSLAVPVSLEVPSGGARFHQKQTRNISITRL